jgi:phage recombination protein Bet
MSNALATLTHKLAKRLDMGDGSGLTETLKLTCFRQRGNDIVTDAQMEALLIVAEMYRLNPFTKELFAFSDKGAIVPVVSVDGWSRIINENPAMNGMEFRYSDQVVTMPRGKPCPEWCEVVIYRRDRERPTVVREYLDEVYQMPRGKDGGYDGPWQTHTKRFLRHKTLIQGARLAFGFAGIYDEDEARRIIDAGTIDASTGEITPQKTAARPERAVWPDDKFAAQVPRWSKAVANGIKTAEEIIAWANGAGALTPEQEKTIRAFKAESSGVSDAQIKGEAPAMTAAEQQAHDAFVAEMGKN